MSTAVLLIDIQQSLCTGPNAAWDCPTLIARINQVTAAARQANTPIIWCATPNLAWRQAPQDGNWPMACRWRAAT